MKLYIRIAKWTGLVVAILALAAIVFMVGRWTAPASGAADDDAAEVTTESDAEREQIYTCPMHPQVRTNDPDELCPICAMELVPLEDDDDEPDDGELPRLRVSERAAALMNIQTVPARRAAAEREVRLYGRVEVDERRRKVITAWAPGRLDELFVDFTGQSVQRDEPMVKLYSPKLIAAQEELLQAVRAERELRDRDGIAGRSARQSVEAARDRLRLLGVSPAFVDELETTGEVRDHLVINAPRAGTVTRRFVSEGEYVDVGDPLFAIADLSNLWVELSVFESDLQWLHEEQMAEFTTQSIPGRTFEGTVAFIDPVLDEGTRSVRVRIDVPNEDGRLKPGMFVQGIARGVMGADGEPRGRANAEARDGAQLPLVVPAGAPLITGRRAVVYVKLRDTERPTFEARDVLLGPRAGDSYVVFEGLEEGDLVVVNGQFRIDSELQIRGRPSMMQPEESEEDAKTQAIVTDDHPAQGVTPGNVPDAVSAQLAAALEEYLALVDALSQDDFESAEMFAHEMHERLYDVDADMLDESVRDAWDHLDQDLHDALHEMLEVEDIAGMRRALEPLTEFASLMVGNFIGDRDGMVYRAHCPMVDDNRGADWLQRGRDITNPYFGSQMFRCGVIVGEVGRETDSDEQREDESDHVAPDPVSEPASEPSDEPRDADFPDAFIDEAREVLDQADQISNAIERGHEQDVRKATRTMQNGLLGLDLAGLNQATMQAWLRIDIDIADALRAMLDAESLDGMREHLPGLRDDVQRARELMQSNEEGGNA